MKLLLFGQQLFHGLPVHLIGHAAIYRAYRRALRFFMKALAFRAFIGNDIIGIDADGSIAFVGVYHGAVEQRIGPFDAGTVGDGPFHATFINSIIRTFGFAGAAVDAFFCYLNSHFF